MERNRTDELNRLVVLGQNKELEYQQRLDALLEFEKAYMRLHKEERIQYEYLLYLAYRELATLYYTTNVNAEESNKYFERSFELLEKGSYDSNINLCISKSMYCKSLILTGLKGNSINFEKAKKCFMEIEAVLRKEGRSDLLEAVDELHDLLLQIDNKNVWTIVNFEIPYHVNLPEDKEYQFSLNGILCKVIKTRKESPRRKNGLICENGYIFNKQDKYGLFNYSRVTVSINEYVEPNENINVNRELKGVWKSVARAIEVWNYFLKFFRIATQEYWLDEINEFMILNYDTKICAGDRVLRYVPWSYAIGFSLCSEVPCVTEEDEKLFYELLGSRNIYIWEIAYLEALNKIQVRNYKEAIIQINIALENYLYMYAEKLLRNNIGEEATYRFLKGENDYNNFYLKDYISEKDYNELVKKEVIKNNPPTTYGIISKCAIYWDSGISKRSVTKKVSSIRKYRNDIVHGTDIKVNLKSICEEAISSFEELQTIINFER